MTKKENPGLAAGVNGTGKNKESGTTLPQTVPANIGPQITPPYGALPGEWEHFSGRLNLMPDLLPVVSDPGAVKSPDSSISTPGKLPSLFNRKGEMVGIKEWPKRTTTHADIAKWSKDNRLGICLNTRNIRALDVDVSDLDMATDIEVFVDEFLGVTLPTRRRSNSAKFAKLFLMPGDLSKTKFKVHTPDDFVEVLATGQQIVIAGIHVSGVRYYFEGGLPCTIPELSRERYDALLAALHARFGSEPSVTVRQGQAPTVKRRAADINDPKVAYMVEHMNVYDITDEGRVDYECEFFEGHSTESGTTSCSYYPAGVGGIAVGRTKCLHASCAGRIERDRDVKNGWMAHGFEVIEEEPLAGEYIPADDKPKEGPLQAFYAYLPEHKYIHRPTRALWPMASVNGSLEGISIGKDKPAAWLDKHRAIHQMTWAPGMPEVVVDKIMADGAWINLPGQNVYNLYRPPVVVPGDAHAVDLWRQHLRTLYPGESEAVHIEKWFAQRVQFPGEKINHALVLGGSQGIGKDTLLEPVKRAVGAWNWGDINPQNLLGQFNPYVKSVVLRVNETHNLGEQTRFAFYDSCKTLIAAPPDVLNCNEKNTKQYAVVNIMGVVFTTNHKTDGIYLPIEDRRHFVAWSSKTKEDFAPEYWQTIWRWLDDEGCANVAAFLRSLDISGFDAKAPPPRTEAFYAIVSANNNPRDVALSATITDEMGSPDVLTLDDILTVIGDDVVEDDEVREFLSSRSTRRNIPHAMERAGYEQVRNEGATDGLWKLASGKRKTIYGRKELSFAAMTKAAKARIELPDDVFAKNCKEKAARLKAEHAEHAVIR